MTGVVMVSPSPGGVGCGGKSSSKSAVAEKLDKKVDIQEQNQLSLLDFILSALRKSMASTCRVDHRQDQEVISAAVRHMEIGWPTNVQHITHVTFDRFHGFLGLPVEFAVEIPCRAPSASVSVFGVSADSMQCSYDARGNSVPTILLLMQERLYSQGGLKSEGVFRINPENSKEEYVRDQLNRGIVPEDIDVHCLAGLIKAWFRELPCGVLDGLSAEQVLQCSTDEDSVELIKQLKPTEHALLVWAVNLMADVVEQEDSNKMNARNIAMVFAPNMTQEKRLASKYLELIKLFETFYKLFHSLCICYANSDKFNDEDMAFCFLHQMSDPLTALMHAVQVMNLLKTLIRKTIYEREEGCGGGYSPLSSHSSDRQTDEEYDDSQREMDTSCASTGLLSDEGEEEEEDLYGTRSKDGEELGCLSEIEESFLRQLDENENAKNGFREQLERILCMDNAGRESGSPFSNGDPISRCRVVKSGVCLLA
ncbi:Rho GTPase-activating protein 2 [Orobanche gracilis]